MLIFKNHTHTKLISSTAIATFLLMASPAFAQVENATQIADPARISQDLLNLGSLPEVSEKIEVNSVAMQNAPAGSEEIRFQLNNLEIDGVGIYSAEDIDYLYREKLGTTISLADIYTIASDLTNKYRNEGYILTQVVVPPQEIENGLVKLRVIEGFVDQIAIEGEEDDDASEQIRRYAANMQKGGVLNSKKLEHYLLLINDLPGIKARSILSPSKTVIGASDLAIVVKRDKYEAEISVDNHGSRYLGPYQASFSGAANSPFGYNERYAVQLVISGDKHRADELLFGSFIYDKPIFSYGTNLRLVASVTSTEPGDNLDQFDVMGNSQFFSAGISHPFVRSRTTNISSRLTFDYRDVNSKNNLEPTNRKDHIRSVRVGTNVQFMDTLVGIGINSLDLEISQGVNLFVPSTKGRSSLTRADGKPKYTKVKAKVQRLQRIVPKVNLLLSGEGQWAATPLLSSEEFGVGGINIGRGYDSSEIVGDDGIAGKAELQWSEPKKIPYIDGYQLFGFVDAGRVWDQDATTSANKRESIVSTGFGVRMDVTDKTKAGFGVAFPLTRKLDVTNDRDPRYYFNVTHKF